MKSTDGHRHSLYQLHLLYNNIYNLIMFADFAIGSVVIPKQTANRGNAWEDRFGSVDEPIKKAINTNRGTNELTVGINCRQFSRVSAICK
jgi:hypothetical protein